MTYLGSHAIKSIPLVATYFGNDGYALVAAEFVPGKGWIRQTYRKRVSQAWLRKLRGEGVTHVALSAPDSRYLRGVRTADFSIRELLSRAKG